MNENSVAIVGLGSRGLSVLERITTLAAKAGPSAGQLRIEIIDPSGAGSGVHDPGQPDYLMLNTTCGQVSMFPDAHSVGADTGEPGPNLHEWATERGLRLGGDGFTVGPRGRDLRPTDFLPRRVLGEYLAWFFEEVRRRAPGHVKIITHRAEAVALAEAPGGGLLITLADGTGIEAGYAFLTTGYACGEPGQGAAAGARLIADPYPMPARFSRVEPGQVVAVEGFGLSAMDLISCLTVGRGGRYVTDQGQLAYLPGGGEPTLLIYSRSGVPCRARPLVTQFEIDYEPLVFTPAHIDALRAARPGPLDFDADVLPLILAEMRIAYRRCQARWDGPDAEQSLVAALREAVAERRYTALLDELDARLGPFDAAGTFAGSAGMRLADSAAYQGWLADTIRRDLGDGVLGFAKSPVKAALDILRELRDVVRYAVDFGGLTPESLAGFYLRTVPLMNRAVVGPQYERHAELLALIAAGVARVPFGPAPEVTWDERAGRWDIRSTRLGVPCRATADWLALGRVAMPGLGPAATPLLASLHRAGWVRRHLPGCGQVNGIDVDSGMHPLRADGRPEPRIWALGPVCEGATFYNNLVPSPGRYSRPIADAHRCAAAMLAAAQASAAAA